MSHATITAMMSRLTQSLLFLCLLFAAAGSQAMERVTYYHNDALGSPVAATDASGTLLWREEYAPYGERLKKEASSKDTTWYTGKQEERTFGINYFGARWYDPQIGRFMGVDPVGFDPGNIHSFSKYTYANNNPYVYVDPDGNLPILVPLAVAIAKEIGGELASHYLGVPLSSRAALKAGVKGIGKQLAKTRTRRDVTKGVGKASDKAPDFVVSPGGTAFPVPKGATGPTPVVNPGGKTTGSAFTGGKGGSNGQVDTMRIMNPTPPRGKSPGYPSGYIKYEKKAGQGVDPYTGRTLSNKNSHFPID